MPAVNNADRNNAMLHPLFGFPLVPVGQQCLLVTSEHCRCTGISALQYFKSRCRDVLYLDLALDGAVRSAVESSLTQIRGPASSKSDADKGTEEDDEEEAQTSMLIELITICAESVCLSAGSNLELTMVHKDYQVSSIASDIMRLLIENPKLHALV